MIGILYRFAGRSSVLRLDIAASVEHDHDTVDAVEERVYCFFGVFFGALAEFQIEGNACYVQGERPFARRSRGADAVLV
jgi:hypothetical protein